MLSLRRPGDEAASKEDSVAGGGAAGVGAAGLVSVGVDHELSRSRVGNDKAKVKSALKVAKDPLGNHKMSVPGIMHV